MWENEEAPPSLKLVHRRDVSNQVEREGSQLDESSIKTLPNKDTREHSHMAPTALVQCDSGIKQSSRGQGKARQRHK